MFFEVIELMIDFCVNGAEKVAAKAKKRQSPLPFHVKEKSIQQVK